MEAISCEMKHINRRDFLRSSATVLAVAGCGTAAGACRTVHEGAGEPRWRYAICNEIMQDWAWSRQCSYAAEIGYQGLEVAPFTLANHVDDISADRRAELRETAREAGVPVIGLHWLLVTPEGLHVTTPDEDLRRRSWDYVVALAELCTDLGGDIMIFGSPGQRSSQGTSSEEAVAHLTDGLVRVAPALASHDVKLLLEPLSSDQTDVINTLEDAVRVVQDVDHPAVSAMYDFHNTADERLALAELVHRYAGYIDHIQIQEMDGTYLGTGDAEQEFVPALRAFRDIGYDGWLSLEVFDFEAGPETIAAESIATLRRMEDAVTSAQGRP